MAKKIRSLSLSSNIDKKLEEDSRYRGLTISANVSRILYDYFIENENVIPKKVLFTSEKPRS